MLSTYRLIIARLANSKLLYAACFCIFVPFLIWWGAKCLDPYMRLTPVHSLWGGALLAITGFILMILAMIALKTKGGGLPMNAFPPPRFVSTGVYRLVPHPIYTGFCSIVAGVSISVGSPAGLYVMLPLSVIGCCGIIYGYERQGLVSRFGRSTPDTLVGLPPDNEQKLKASTRITGIGLILLSWATAYYIGGQSGVIDGAPSCRIFGEKPGPVTEWSVWFYTSVYLMAPLTLMLAKTNGQLRRLAVVCHLSFWCGLFLFMMVPFSCPLQDFTPGSLAGRLLLHDRSLLPLHCIAFPSYHVIWALIIAWFITTQISRRWAVPVAVWAILMSWSCVATGMHGYLDLFGAALVVALVVNRQRIAAKTVAIACKIANSWHEYRIGPLRILNHAFYSFLAAATGYYLAVYLAGESFMWPVFIVAMSSLAGAGLWGQFVEGSSRLLRPFGYYGAIFGGLAGLAIILAFYPVYSLWILFGALACSAPWIQAIGRLRCLVQGCCHGRPLSIQTVQFGIIHTNPASRVCKLTSWQNISLHPTPLYSIICNALTGWLLVHLWNSEMPVGLIIGLYFILNALGRFIEEAYRGEPQTLRRAGLSLYQWLSIAFILAGFVIWSLPDAMIPPLTTGWHLAPLPGALLTGVIYAFMMSCDFPGSNKRFSRLTS